MSFLWLVKAIRNFALRLNSFAANVGTVKGFYFFLGALLNTQHSPKVVLLISEKNYNGTWQFRGSKSFAACTAARIGGPGHS